MTEQQREAILSAIKEIDAIAAHNAGYFPVDAPGQPEIHELCGKVEGALAALSHAEGEAVEIEAPEFHAEGMGCGLEDRGITDRYEAMEYGFNEAVEQYEAIIDGYGQLYTHPAPQVAVPEAKNLDALTDREDKLMAAGWNECRAAMAEGGEHG